MLSLQSTLKPLTSNFTRTLLTKQTFSTTAVMGKTEWMCILPDKPNALEARMKIRPQHLENIKPKVKSGLIVMGGASLDEPIQEGAGPKINGSIMIVESETQEEAEKVIKEDIYYTSGVWDPEKVQIFPFKSAVREALS